LLTAGTIHHGPMGQPLEIGRPSLVSGATEILTLNVFQLFAIVVFCLLTEFNFREELFENKNEKIDIIVHRFRY
jgi:hypothetical protein